MKPDPSRPAPSEIDPPGEEPKLRRAIGLPLLVLYGLGITIGAGIYVLIGSVAAKAGDFAPTSFLFAAVVMAFSAASFAEFSGRIPQSAGEAVYVDAGFGQNWLTLATGLFIVFSATIAGAAIAIGCAGYISTIVPLPPSLIVAAIIILMGLLAARGIRESVMFAGVLTVIEILGLVIIIVSGYWSEPAMFGKISSAIPAFDDTAALTGIFSASLIAFFAFIGFDDVVNLVEETHNPKRTMPWAIGISLIAVTVIYFLVVFVAVQTVPAEELAGSAAPIGLLFERLTGISPLGITLIAIFATLNGVVIEIIMASRVIYGLGKKGHLPGRLSRVDPVTQTPLNATLLITAVMLAGALFVSLDFLVTTTSQIILAVFALVNLALVVVKLRGDPAPEGVFTVPVVLPVFGAVSCIFLLLGPLFID
ncbi:MAG: amino acid permease [Hyphomicrobiales bacterium]|nr:amino acid permease [Hyphomicrobiales bacterium]